MVPRSSAVSPSRSNKSEDEEALFHKQFESVRVKEQVLCVLSWFKFPRNVSSGRCDFPLNFLMSSRTLVVVDYSRRNTSHEYLFSIQNRDLSDFSD